MNHTKAVLILIPLVMLACSKNQFSAQKAPENSQSSSNIESGLYYKEVNFYEPSARTRPCEVYTKTNSSGTRARTMITAACGVQTVGYRLLEGNQVIASSSNTNLFLGGSGFSKLPLSNYQSTNGSKISSQFFDGQMWVNSTLSVGSGSDVGSCMLTITEKPGGILLQASGACLNQGIGLRSQFHLGYVLDTLTPELEAQVQTPVSIAFKIGADTDERIFTLEPGFGQKLIQF